MYLHYNTYISSVSYRLPLYLTTNAKGPHNLMAWMKFKSLS